MDDILPNDSPAYIDYINRHYYRIQKFYLVLQHADGTEFDGISCLPCLPWCRKPVYKPGQHITGHILIRPLERMIITGVKILFEGLYKTKWKEKEHGIKWFGMNSFYKDLVNLISNRTIELESRWYKFDFEHVLPSCLLQSMKEAGGEIIYHAIGFITTTVDSCHIQTPNTSFNIDATVDINVFPERLQEAITRSAVKTFHNPKSISEQCKQQYHISNQINTENQCRQQNGASPDDDRGNAGGNNRGVQKGHSNNAVLPMQHQQLGLTTGVSLSQQENEVTVTLWLNKQVIAIGQQLHIELNIDNIMSGAIRARLIIKKTIRIKANFAEKKASGELIVPLDTYVQKTTRKEVLEIWSATLPKCSTKSVSLHYKVHDKVTPSLPCLRARGSVTTSDDGGQTPQSLASSGSSDGMVFGEPLIYSSYHIELELTPQWDKSTTHTAISTEVWLASRAAHPDTTSNALDTSTVMANTYAMAYEQCPWGSSSAELGGDGGGGSQNRRCTENTEMITYSHSLHDNLQCDLTVETSLDNCALHADQSGGDEIGGEVGGGEMNHVTRSSSASWSAEPFDSEGPPAYQRVSPQSRRGITSSPGCDKVTAV